MEKPNSTQCNKSEKIRVDYFSKVALLILSIVVSFRKVIWDDCEMFVNINTNVKLDWDAYRIMFELLSDLLDACDMTFTWLLQNCKRTTTNKMTMRCLSHWKRTTSWFWDNHLTT